MHSHFMTPEESRAIYRRARRLGKPIDWDGADGYEMTKADWADAAERQGMPELAAQLRAEYDAEAEQRELEGLEKELARAAAEHELRSQRAKRGAQTRKQRQAERAAAVTAAEAIVADARARE